MIKTITNILDFKWPESAVVLTRRNLQSTILEHYSIRFVSWQNTNIYLKPFCYNQGCGTGAQAILDGCRWSQKLLDCGVGA